MVAMGTSFADRAWGRESAVYRVTGVLTVIGGWFMTALTAFSVSFLFAIVIWYGQTWGVVLLLGLGAWIIWQNHHLHLARAKSSRMEKVFNLKKVSSIPETISTTFEHTAYLLREIRVSLDAALEGLFRQNQYALGAEKSKSKKIQHWANIIVANVFKAMRLLQRGDAQPACRYGQTVRRLQKLADGHRDIVVRSYMHVGNQHKGLLDAQVEELREVKRILHDIFLSVESTLARKRTADIESLVAQDRGLRDLADRLHQKQLERIRDGSSKTRLNILFYAILGNAVMLSRQNVRLLEIFAESFGGVDAGEPFDLE
jgi:hypothetical protein